MVQETTRRASSEMRTRFEKEEKKTSGRKGAVEVEEDQEEEVEEDQEEEVDAAKDVNSSDNSSRCSRQTALYLVIICMSSLHIHVLLYEKLIFY